MASSNLSTYNKNLLPSAEPYSFAIITAEWNSHITHNLLSGAINTLLDLGAKKNAITTYDVPGAVELVNATRQVLTHKKNDAIIVIGCVIKGETAHFDYVCSAVTQGITSLNAQQDTPIIFCLLTDNNEQQSLDRSGGALGNKGIEAAVSALKMAHLSVNL